MKRLLRYALLAGTLLWSVPAHAIFSNVASGSGKASCTSGTTCGPTLSPGTAGAAAFVMAWNDVSLTVSSCCGSGCTTSWTLAQTQVNGIHVATVWYCLNTATGSSIVIGPTWSGACTAGPNCATEVGTWSSSLGTIALNSGATPKLGCTTATAWCALTVSANNSIYAGAIANAGTITACTGGATCNIVNGNATGWIINQTAYGAKAWTGSATTLSQSIVAIQETGSAASDIGIDKRTKLDRLGANE